MMHRLFTLAVLTVFTVAAAAVELDQLLEKGSGLWELSGDSLQKELPRNLQFLDSSRKRLRGVPVKASPMTLFGSGVQELLAEIGPDGKVSKLTVSIYNRGDAGNMDISEFRQKLRSLIQKFSKFTDVPVPAQQSAFLAGAKVYSRVWKNDKFDLILRWSTTNNRTAEYIALDAYRPGTAPKNLRDSLKSTTSRDELSSKIINDPDGSRYLFVPMVDQGQKGYCVAATAERMLRYYGSNVDQHVIAQLAKSDAKRGTSMQAALEALDDAKSRLGVRIKPLITCEMATKELRWNTFTRLTKDYNSRARKSDARELRFKDYVKTRGRTKYLNVDALLSAMDPQIYTEMRCEDKGNYQDFFKEIQRNIDAGIPLCWVTITLPHQADNNTDKIQPHMRIINGYNTRTGDVIYTDSWGLGHEKKVMSRQDAWGITQMLCAMTPRGR